MDVFELTKTLDEFEGNTNEELKRKLMKTKEPLPPFRRKLVPGLNKRPACAHKKK
jgi:hypothetical protein